MIQSPVLLAEIAVFGALAKTLHYLIPRELQGAVRAGIRVLVPLGRRQVTGLVLGTGCSPSALSPRVQLRSICRVLDPLPLAPPDLIELCRWISRYYFYPPGEVFQTVLPPGLGDTPRQVFHLTQTDKIPRAAENPSESSDLPGDNPGPIDTMPSVTGPAGSPTSALFSPGAAAITGCIPNQISLHFPARKVKSLRLLRLPESHEMEDNEDVRSFLAILEKADEPLPMRTLRPALKNIDYWVRKLRRKGILDVEEIAEPRKMDCAQALTDTAPKILSAGQANVFETVSPFLSEPAFQVFLLFGVTGSGKTEIYLQLVAEAFEHGRGSLILVPEIALSSQMEALFRSRFDSEVAIWHSGLSPAARREQWADVLSGRKRVVLGVRSAVFMPVANLGLLIVDEEHDSSYKQDDHLRYHARDVALMRARMLEIPVVLGSATPSLQSFHHSTTNLYKILRLPTRVMDRPLPTIEVVDMRRESRGNRILSQSLKNALAETLQNSRQALLFLNRRGFATFYLCNVCGHVLQCLNCSVSLTYHQKADRLNCHYCGWETPVPESCPLCGHASLVPHGFGTERVEEEVRRFLPEARVIRMDRDTAGRPGAMLESLNALRHERANVLVGTQMVAKGHDFPKLTLVGVVNADTALQLADYRAGETTVQTLMQVAGRAGRGEMPGQVILQTYNPDHYTIRSVLKMDYEDFCSNELESRRQLQYPPFTRMLKLLVTATNEEAAKEAARVSADICRRVALGLRDEDRFVAVLGPSPAPLSRLKNRFRWHIFLKAWTSRALQQFTESVLSEVRSSTALRHAQVAVDRDPTMNL